MKFIKRVDFGKSIRPAVFCMEKNLVGFYRLTVDTIIIDETHYQWWVYNSHKYVLAFPREKCDHVLLFMMDFKKPLPFSRRGELYQLSDFNPADRPLSAYTNKPI